MARLKIGVDLKTTNDIARQGLCLTIFINIRRKQIELNKFLQQNGISDSSIFSSWAWMTGNPEISFKMRGSPKYYGPRIFRSEDFTLKFYIPLTAIRKSSNGI